MPMPPESQPGYARCWYCDTPTDMVVDVTKLPATRGVYLHHWKTQRGDDGHLHNANPPSAQELAAAGHEALLKVIKIWGE